MQLGDCLGDSLPDSPLPLIIGGNPNRADALDVLPNDGNLATNLNELEVAHFRTPL